MKNAEEAFLMWVFKQHPDIYGRLYRAYIRDNSNGPLPFDFSVEQRLWEERVEQIRNMEEEE